MSDEFDLSPDGAYSERVERDCALARFLAEEIDRRPDFERLAEPVLSIVNYRYRPRGRGIQVAMRVCIVNFRTREVDLVALLDASEKHGRELAGGSPP